MLRLLARREYFRAELAARVRAAQPVDEARLHALLDECERLGWLSDERAARQAVTAGMGRYGAARLERDLLARGASPQVVATALAALRDEDGSLPARDAGAQEDSESARARAVLRRRFGAAAADDDGERARRARFLAGRGFGEAVIAKILGLGDESQQQWHRSEHEEQ